MKKLGILALVGILGISVFLVGCSAKAETKNSEAKADEVSSTLTVKIGLVGEKNEIWERIRDDLAPEGITIKLIRFSDYTIPNAALDSKEIDLNAFQHKAFLANEIKNKGYKLQAISNTIIAPLGIYSKKIKDVSELKNGDLIALPNDTTNGGRALKLLESAGIIKVKPEAGYTPTLDDIIENPKNLKFKEIEAAQTPKLLEDVAASVINNGHANDHGLVPAKDSIFLEKVDHSGDNPYINVIVARTDEKDKEVFKKIVAAYCSPATEQQIEELYKGSFIRAW